MIDNGVLQLVGEERSSIDIFQLLRSHRGRGLIPVAQFAVADRVDADLSLGPS